MAIHPGHEFKKEHGYTGSASKEDHRPKIHGFEYGGGVDHLHKGGKENNVHLKMGAFVHNAKEHFGKSGHVDHDAEHVVHKATHPTHYDEHGFQHLKHGGKAKHHKE